MPSASNTPAMYYLDTQDAKTACKKDKEDLEKQCAPDDRNPNRRKGKPVSRTGHKDNGKEGNWVMDHCGPLLMKPGEDFEEWYKQFKNIDSLMKKIAVELKDKVIGKIEEELLQYGTKAVGKMAVRRGLTGWIPVVGWIMTAVDVAVTAVDVASKVSDMRETVAELKSTVDALKAEAADVTRTFDKYKNELKNFPNLSQKDKDRISREVMVDVQTAYAAANPCLRARKCMLVPYRKGGADKWLGKGCCPGQTGHHLLPDSMFRDPKKGAAAKAAWAADPANLKDGKLQGMPRGKLPKLKCWENYSEGGAPTICAEGANQHAGSHGRIHAITDQALGVRTAPGATEMPYTRARDLALDEISRLYGCSKRCLQEQLDSYYCGKAADKNPPCSGCKQSPVAPNSGKGGPRDGDDETDNSEI